MQKARHEQSRRTWCTPWAELEALRKLVSPSGDTLATSGQKLEQPAVEALGLSKREQDELIAKLGPAEKPDFELDMTQAKPAEYFAERMNAAVPKGDVTLTE